MMEGNIHKISAEGHGQEGTNNEDEHFCFHSFRYYSIGAFLLRANTHLLN